ncbi:MAG: 3-deoxy-manno-octulosonate cytidylyltransferase [Sulfurimonas sp.]|jgi:3-deoxy-manno-octulosonate cytidylyltransferase (CMP-KDO synthetase)|nr:3-deoxy-manno-octulosonate cytidylyltransferase [Sulfurimonadaceae bacterium]
MIIIPARLASTRFEQKVLVDVAGLPMVVRTAKRVAHLDRVVVAADDEKIVEVCKNYGVEAILTSKEHNSGTDRINEAAKKLNLSDDELVINVQADEPFIEDNVVWELLKRLKTLDKNSFVMASAYAKIDKARADDANLVKVVVDDFNNALYFSRSAIPFDRSGGANYFGHIGIYGFNKKSLEEFCSFKPSSLEDIEKLEQLRALANGKKISMIEVNTKSFGIDTKEDLARALEVFVN